MVMLVSVVDCRTYHMLATGEQRCKQPLQVNCVIFSDCRHNNDLLAPSLYRGSSSYITQPQSRKPCDDDTVIASTALAALVPTNFMAFDICALAFIDRAKRRKPQTTRTTENILSTQVTNVTDNRPSILYRARRYTGSLHYIIWYHLMITSLHDRFPVWQFRSEMVLAHAQTAQYQMVRVIYETIVL